MYAAHFGLRENPFRLSPEPDYLFLSRQHRDALNYLKYGIIEKKGFILITGGIGTGKTTLCRSLLRLLDDTVETALIFNTAVSEAELLESVAREFGIAVSKKAASKKYFIDAINAFLLKNFAEGKKAVLLIDEAQNLSHGVLEQIRMLSNLETEKDKLLQIILVGQPELKTTLARPALRQLNERITVRYELDALSPSDVMDYIDHRLGVAGGPGALAFTRFAHRRIYDYSEGIPRRINALCDRALLIAYAKGAHRINRKIIGDAARDIGKAYFSPTLSWSRKWWVRLTM